MRPLPSQAPLRTSRGTASPADDASSWASSSRRRRGSVYFTLALVSVLLSRALSSSSAEATAAFAAAAPVGLRHPGFLPPLPRSRRQHGTGRLPSRERTETVKKNIVAATPSDAEAEAAAEGVAKLEENVVPESSTNELSPAQAVINMAKGIVGGGMLALPVGLAAMKRGPAAVLPAVLFLVTPLGILSASTYYNVARICERTGTTSYGAAWAACIRGRLKFLMSIVLVFSCGTGCVSYAMVLGDTIPCLLQSFFGPSFNLLSRSSSILLLTLGIFYPLSRLQNLASLGKFSLLGNLGNVFVIIFMGVRFFQGAYAAGGPYAVPAKTLASPTLGGATDVLILSSILSTAFVGHFNAPNMYRELKATSPEKKILRFKGVVLAGFLLSGAAYASVMIFGFLTFGNGCLGNILDNYSAQDPFTIFAKVGVGISLLFGHPLMFMGCKDNLEALIGKRGSWLPILLLTLATGMAINLHDLGRLQALRGAVAGTFLAFIGPSLMASSQSSTNRGRAGHLAVAALGVFLCVSGLWASLK